MKADTITQWVAKPRHRGPTPNPEISRGEFIRVYSCFQHFAVAGDISKMELLAHPDGWRACMAAFLRHMRKALRNVRRNA